MDQATASDDQLAQINFITNTDPILAGLCVMTFVYFGWWEYIL